MKIRNLIGAFLTAGLFALFALFAIGIHPFHVCERGDGLHLFYAHQHGDGVHTCCLDFPEGAFTDEKIAELLSRVPDTNLSSKTRAVLPWGPTGNDLLTLVIDFKEEHQPVTTDVFGYRVGPFQIEEYGFTEADFSKLTNALLAEVIDDYFW